MQLCSSLDGAGQVMSRCATIFWLFRIICSLRLLLNSGDLPCAIGSSGTYLGIIRETNYYITHRKYSKS